MNRIAVAFAFKFLVDVANFRKRARFAVWNIEEVVPEAIIATLFENNPTRASADKYFRFFAWLAIGEAMLDAGAELFFAAEQV